MQSQLWVAWQRFRRGKKPTPTIDTFAYHIESNIQLLSWQIQQRTYRHSTYKALVVREKKRRQLAVAAVRDRIVHRLVYDQLVHLFDATFDADVWSCRLGKGLHPCLARIQQLVRAHPHAYVWRMDITKFFDNVEHATLAQCLQRRVNDPELLWLCQQIITSYNSGSSGKGIPIGNLTSQVFANIYLHEFDRYVRHTLKPLAYVRYGDDVVLWGRRAEDALAFQAQAKQFLAEKLALTVNPKNDVVFRSHSGVHMLGHVITRSYVVVDTHTTRSVLEKSDARSIASYKALHLAAMPRKQLDWLLLDELQAIDSV